MADRDSYCAKWKKKFDKVVDLINAGQAELAAQQLAHEIVKEAKPLLENQPEVFQAYRSILKQFTSVPDEQKFDFVIDPLPDAPCKNSETLRRAALDLITQAQFGGLPVPAEPSERLMECHMQELQEHLFLSKLEANASLGKERQLSSKNQAVIAEVRQRTRDLYRQVAEKSQGGQLLGEVRHQPADPKSVVKQGGKIKLGNAGKIRGGQR